MAHMPDAALLDQARKRVGLSIDELWMCYFAMGGKADPFEFEAILHGVLKPESYQYNIVAQALNECLSDRGESDLVPYATTD